MNIIFFGSDPWFSPPVLGAILRAGHEVPVAITKGQGLKAKGQWKTKIIQVENSLSPHPAGQSLWAAPLSLIPTRPDAVVLAAFGPPFLSKEVLNWSKYGCLNVHASLLPRWRGASPVFGAIAAGDKETGVSIMRMTEEIDLGPILGQKRIVIRPGLATQGQAFTDYDTRETLTRRLGILGGKLIVETLKNIENGQINEVEQQAESPTPYTRRLTKDSGRIDWRFRPGETSPERSRRIERFIRAVTPWPGAWTEYRDKGQGTRDKDKMLKILKTHLLLSPSLTLNPQPLALSPSLIIDLVQLPGKNPISWKAFLAGHPGAKLE